LRYHIIMFGGTRHEMCLLY